MEKRELLFITFGIIGLHRMQGFKADPFEYFVPSMCLYMMFCLPLLFLGGTGLFAIGLASIGAFGTLEAGLSFLDAHNQLEQRDK